MTMMNNSSYNVPASSGLTININKVIGTENALGQGQGQFVPYGQQQQQQQQFVPAYVQQQQNQWGANNNNFYGNNGQAGGQQYGQFNPNGQQPYMGQFPGQIPNQPQNINPFAELNQAWFNAEQARNYYVQLANQMNDQAYLSYINQNPQFTSQQGQYPYGQQQQGQFNQPLVVMNQQQQMTPPPFVNQNALNNPVPNAQAAPSPFPTPVPDGPLPEANANTTDLLEDTTGNQAPVDQTAVPTEATAPAQNTETPAPVDATAQPAEAQQPAPVQENEDMKYYNELSQKPTEELQGMLRSILSLPADSAQAPADEKLYSLQTIEYILDIIKDRPDAATPQTFGLLKELGEMSKVMATMPGADIPQWKREDSKIIWMETLWAAAKLDSMLDNIAVKKLPGFSTMIEPILSGKEEVPPLILMAATQAVSPDVFRYSNDKTVQNLLKDVENRATKAVNHSGKRKWYTAWLGKYKQLSQNESETYRQVAQYANAIRNGQSVSQMPASSGMPQGGMTNAAAAGGFDSAQIDPAMLQQMQAEMEAELAKMSPQERQQFNDAIASVAQDAMKTGALNGTSGGQQPSQADIDALLASLGQPAAKPAAKPAANPAPVAAPAMNAVA